VGLLIEFRELRVRFCAAEAVSGVSPGLDEGEVLGLVGESGSGEGDRAPRRLRKRFERERCE
jgi:ABC-type dipeptide/oligopeptide/nickel transport system ATPase component